jgi:EmrB/QacA subfamily drug resistance transporter
VTLVSFLLLLDDTAVALTLPAIREQLGFGLAGLGWVINAYTLPLAAFMLLGGQMADRYGRRRVFLTGLAIFMAASLLAGLAGSTTLLIIARVVQGIGAAMIAPASLSIIAATFPAGERGWALGVWAGITTTALGLGPLLGALVNDTLGWQWIFLLNVPFGAGVWLAAHALLSETRSAHPARHLDLAGVASSGVALTALMLALTEGNNYGWGSTRELGLAVIVVVGFAMFIRIERRADDPLLDMSLLRRKAFAGSNVVSLLSTAVMCSLFFFLALYLQNVLGFSALSAGIQLLPLTVAIVVVSPLAGRLSDRIGDRLPVAIGMVLLAAALFGLSGLRVDSNVWSLVPWLVLAGVGIGLSTTPATTAAMADPDSDRYGMSAGVLNTSRATGLALGIALMGAVLAVSGGGDVDRPTAFVDGFSIAVTINAVIAIVAAVVATLTLGGRVAHVAASPSHQPTRAGEAR